ncbi:MAG: hypothetical protein ACR2PT_15430 [Endozoicomonas sp.]
MLIRTSRAGFFLTAFFALVPETLIAGQFSLERLKSSWQWVDEQHPILQPLYKLTSNHGVCLVISPATGEQYPGTIDTAAPSFSQAPVCQYSAGGKLYETRQFWALKYSFNLYHVAEAQRSDLTQQPLASANETSTPCVVENPYALELYMGMKEEGKPYCQTGGVKFTKYFEFRYELPGLYELIKEAAYSTMLAVATMSATIGIGMVFIIICVSADNISLLQRLIWSDLKEKNIFWRRRF